MSKKSDMVKDVVMNIGLEEFSISQVRTAVACKYPDVGISNDVIYIVMRDFASKGLIKRGRDSNGCLKFTALSSSDILKGAEDNNTDGVSSAVLANNSKNIKIVMQVARAAIECGLETFTRKDILNFLRSNPDTVGLNEATVLSCISTRLTNRNIIKKIGHKEGNKLIALYQLSSGVVDVQKFFPDLVVPVFVDGVAMSAAVKETSSRSTEPLKTSDLAMSESELGKLVFAHIRSMEDQLNNSIDDRTVLIEQKIKDKAQIEELEKKILQMTNENANLSQLLNESQQRIDILQRENEQVIKDCAQVTANLQEMMKKKTDHTVVLKSFVDLKKISNRVAL